MRPFLSLVLLCFLFASCTQHTPVPPAHHEVLVLAASSLKDAFTEIANELHDEDSTLNITFSFGASNLLARQIEQGARADVFASAAESIVDSLEVQGSVVAASRVTFARNRLVVIVPPSADSLSSLEDLLFPAYQRIAIAAPGVPARIYAEEALRSGGLWDRLQGRFVFGENVRQVVEYVARGEATAGFVYGSDARQFADRVHIALAVDTTRYRTISYPAVLVREGTNREGGEKFLRYLAGEQGRAVLRRFGFLVD